MKMKKYLSFALVLALLVGLFPGMNLTASATGGTTEITPTNTSGTMTITLTIAAASVKTAPTAKALTYSGSAQELITAGEAENGSMQYAVGDNGTTAPTSGFSATVPTGTDAKTYYVWYRATSTHGSSAAACVPVTIGQKSVAGATITLDHTQLTYNGSAQSVSVSGVTVDGKNLTTSDYDVSGNTGTAKGSYTVTITGKGNYTGTATATWDITDKPMSVTAENVTATYDGQPHGITVSVTDPSSGAAVKYGTTAGTYDLDASPTYTNVGTYPVYYQITADNYETKTGFATVTITKKAVTATVTVADKAFDDTTTATVTASVTTGIDGDTITVTGLTGTFASKNIGTGITVTIDSSKATITGADNYNVTIPDSATANITAKSINDSNVTIYAIPDQNATGSAITPDPVIKYLGILLKQGTDYTLGYSNNTAEGTATVTVTGTGNYGGTRTANFKIVRAAYGGTLTVAAPGPYTYGAALGTAPTVNSTGSLSGENVTVYYATTPSGAGTVWNSSTRLNVGTYYVWAELAATSTHDKATSTRVEFKVNKATPAAPSGVLRASYTDTYKVTLTIPSGKTYADYQYVVSTSSSTPADSAWKSLPTLTNGGFTPTEATTQNTTYYVFLRTKADSNNNASAAATATLKTPAKYLLSYDANGSTASVPVSVEYNSGSTVTAAAAITRAGYTFAGWNTAANGGTHYAAGAAFTISANTTLYAQWTPNTYNVAYHGNGATDPAAVNGVAYNAEITLPTPTYAEHTFNGWATVSGGNPVYRGGQKVTGLTSVSGATVDLYAVWTENTYKITGEVKEERDGTTEQSIVAGVTVKIMRGSVEFATTATDDYGKYTFSGIPAGSYNIVATRTVDGKNQTMTALVEVKSDKTVETIVLPPSGINSALDVKGDSTPPVMVGGLDDVAKDEAEENKEVTVTMTVEKKDESSASAEVKQQIEEIKEAVAADTSTDSGNTELEVLDVSVKKETKESSGSGSGSTTTENITETSQVVEIIVSFNMNGRFGFSLYRHHDGKAEPFQSRTSRFAKGSFADGYFFADKAAGLFYIYTSRFSTYAIGYEEGTSYAVTVNSGTGGGDYAEGATVTITADAAPSGKVFDKWTTSDGVTFANASSATTTFTMPAKAVTVTANYKTASTPYTPSSSGYSPSTTTITVPVSGDSASVSVSASVSGTTATVKAPTTAQLDKVIGESVKTGEVTIDVSRLSKNIATVSIPTETVKAIEKAVSDPDNDASALTVKLTDGTVTFDAPALAAIAQQAKGSTIQLNLDGITESGLRTAQKTAIKDMDVQAIYDAYLTSNGQRISDFKGGKATVTVSYTLKDGQIGRGVVVWYVADDGDKSEVPTAYSSKEVTFTVEHFSNYVIAYDAARAAACPKDDTCPISAFSDADPTTWYHDGVHYVLENGIMSGYGNGLFGPGNTTSRAMMAQILWNMEGKPVVNYAMSYTDVDGEAWYTEAVRWATSEKIMSGYGGGKFGPGDAMTREQLVTIMYRYAQYKGVDVSVGEDTNILSYDDALTVSEFAIPAMQWAVGSGAVSGRTNTTLNPKDTATRAEIATIIMRYCTEIAK